MTPIRLTRTGLHSRHQSTVWVNPHHIVSLGVEGRHDDQYTVLSLSTGAYVTVSEPPRTSWRPSAGPAWRSRRDG
jgi:hypothetical protein